MFWAEIHATPHCDVDGKVTGTVCAIADISERKRASEELKRTHIDLQQKALHDALTGIANRTLFNDRLRHAIDRYRRSSDGGFAVLFLDIDRFKLVNDSLGHPVGDSLLVAITERLQNCVRTGDTLARLGGDEFTILMEDVGTIEAATRLAERVQRDLRRPFDLEGKEVHISASIGIVSSEYGYDHPQDVLRDADIAMYRAKALGKARYQVFTKKMGERALNLMALENELRQAMKVQALTVHYQPIVSVETGQLVGFEALTRWHHPTQGMISPAEFIPIAEETGLIIELDRWVLLQACRQAGIWQKQFQLGTSLTISVNISAGTFESDDFAQDVETILSETGFEPSRLKLEITESVLVSHVDSVTSSIEQLSALGVQLHIDDFGTGYSSLSLLQFLPADVLKIDRSFIDNLTRTSESNELVRAINVMAEQLNMQVVAEGVETAEQLSYLKALGCAYAQGYLFSEPLPVEQVEAYLEEPKVLQG